MTQFVLNRTYTYRSTSGVISFEKGVPVAVPNYMEREVMAIGAERVDGEKVDLLDPEKPVEKMLSNDERAAQIYIAFDMISERNDSKDFTGSGVPTVKAVEKIVDFDVDRVELADAWQTWREAKAEA